MSRNTESRPHPYVLALESVEGRDMFAAHIVGSTINYATIQSAVDAASAGAIINVDAGTYNETVTITKSMTLRGAQAGIDGRGTRGAETIIQATQTDFNITANDVTIDGFTVNGYKTNVGAGMAAGIVMGPLIHGTVVVNNIIQNNVTGIYLSNNSNTDAAIIQHNYFHNNTETGEDWTYGWNGSRMIYSDGTVSGGLLTNVLIDSNKFYRDDSYVGHGAIALEALGAGKQFNITVSNNSFNAIKGYQSKALIATNVTNITWIGNNVTGMNDSSSGPVRFEGNANNVNIQYNSIYGNAGPGVGIDSSGTAGDSSGFTISNNNIYSESGGIGVIAGTNQYDGPLVATNNYWGDATGPSGQGAGKGLAVWGAGTTGHYLTPKGAVGNEVTFSPWATSMINIGAIPAPASPLQVRAAIASASSITLTWTAPMSTAISQTLQRSTDGINYTTIATLPPLLTSYTDSGLATLGYYYRVVATNFTGSSLFSNVASTLPSAPSGVRAAAMSPTKVSVIWTDNSPGLAAGYAIQRSTDGVNFYDVGTAAAGAKSFVDTTAQAATSYAYRIRVIAPTGTSAWSAAGTTTTLTAASKASPLSGLNWTSATSGYNTPQNNYSVLGNTITLNGVTYASGIGTHASSTIVYNLGGKYSGFTSVVGVDDEVTAKGTGTVRFQVIGDGKVLYDSGLVQSGATPGVISLNVVGVTTLTLVATPGNADGSIDFCHADWAGATLYADPNAVQPAAIATVIDGGFETPSLGTGTSASSYNPAGSAWTFIGDAGLAGNGSVFTSSNANAPTGTQVAFLQRVGSISQSASNWAAGTYQLSFLAAQRGGSYQAAQEDFQVLIDGKVVGTFTPSSTNYQNYTTSAFTVSAGAHTILFKGLDTATGDNATLIDGVTLTGNTLSAPTGLNATATAKGVRLAWTAGPTASSFVLQRSTDGVTFVTLSDTIAGNATGYLDATTVAGANYFYRLMMVSGGSTSAASTTVTAATFAATAYLTPLSSFSWTNATAGWGSVAKNQNVTGGPIRVGGNTYATGIGTHAPSVITYALDGTYTNFISDIGLDNNVDGRAAASVDFQVFGDGKLLFDSGAMTNTDPVKSVNVSIAGVKTLSLVVNSVVAGDIDYAQVDWAGAQLVAASAPAPAAATGLTAAATSSTQVRLAWTNVAPVATSVLVQRSSDGMTFTTVATLAANATGYLDSGLTAGTTYTYRLMTVNGAVTSAASTTAARTTLAATASTVAVSSLTWTSATAGWGTPQNNASIAGTALTLRGTHYASGIGTHASSTIVYNLAGKYTRFLSDVGIDDEVNGNGIGSGDFQVFGDGKLLYDSGTVMNTSNIASLDVDVTGVTTLTLVVNAVNNNIDYAHADWANARLLPTVVTPTVAAAVLSTPATAAATPVVAAKTATVAAAPAVKTTAVAATPAVKAAVITTAAKTTAATTTTLKATTTTTAAAKPAVTKTATTTAKAAPTVASQVLSTTATKKK